MKKTILLFISTLLCSILPAQESTALLMVHFGTTYDDTRTQTIDAINAKARQTFPGLTIAECYTSDIVRKRLAARGIEKESAVDALLRLRAEGHRRVTVQPTFIIEGKQMADLRHDIERVRPFFDNITLGTPLLYSLDDAQSVCDILAARHAADPKKHEHVLFVGHGTEGPATAIYAQLDYMLCNSGHANCHVATIEGYPTMQTAIALLKGQKAKTVVLVPLLFTAGNHAADDISVEWKETLEQEGFKVRLEIEGLGEVKDIQQIYVNKIRRSGDK